MVSKALLLLPTCCQAARSIPGDCKSGCGVGQHGDGDVAGGHAVCCAARHAGALALQLLALVRGPVPDSDTVPRFHQVPCLHHQINEHKQIKGGQHMMYGNITAIPYNVWLRDCLLSGVFITLRVSLAEWEACQAGDFCMGAFGVGSGRQ